MSEKEQPDTVEPRQAPSQGREKCDDAWEESWDSYSLEVLHALDD
jgi:hypothetical protein